MGEQRTAYLYEEVFLDHVCGTYQGDFVSGPHPDLAELEVVHPHPESPRRLLNILWALRRSGLAGELLRLPARRAGEEEIARVHRPEMIREVEEACRRPGGAQLADLTPVGRGSYEAALWAAGASMEAVDAVVTGRARNAFALVRPPGHHAEPDRAMGFCLFNNAALAAEQARRVHRLERVMVLDWDVHHGNGTQAAFWSDPGVLFISLHQHQHYPLDTGLPDRAGEGRGRGFNVNLSLSPGLGDEDYLHAFERVIEPVAEQFRPQIVLVSCGFDAHFADPWSHMLVTQDGFREMARRTRALAERLCGGRLVALLEGGYCWEALPYCAVAVLEGFGARDTGLREPFQIWRHPLSANGRDSVERTVRVHREFWKLG
jgi:acetoin utilization deacetylase AcuC-like enzyme